MSLFAGLGGIDLALERQGFECLGQVELEPFPRAILRRRWPHIPKHDDVRTAVDWWHHLHPVNAPQVDLVCGGFPCTDVSQAGKRAGLKDADGNNTRSGLFFDAVKFIEAVRPRAVLLENVPGLLTSQQGRDFGTILDSLAEVGYLHIEWRVCDSKYFGVPQRRRRVFVVATLGPTRRPQVLLEPEGSVWHPSPREQAWPEATRAPAARAGSSGPTGYGTGVTEPDTAGTLGATTGGFRTTDLDGIGAYVLTAEQDCVTALTASIGTGGPHLANAQAGWLIPTDPVGPLTTTGLCGPDARDAQAGHLLGHPDPAGTVTTRIGKGINSTLDDGAVAYRAPAGAE